MRRDLHLVILDDPHGASTLSAWLTGSLFIPREDVLQFQTSPLWADSAIADRFEIVADWIEKVLENRFGDNKIPHVVAYVDLEQGASLDHLSPINHHGDSTVIGMLILAYPEINWLFCTRDSSSLAHADPSRPGTADTDVTRLALNFAGGPAALRDRIALLDGNLPPIFDRTGLRDRIRTALVTDPRQDANIVRRRASMIAIDEESAYAWLHAYIGYRFGYLADAVTSLRGMQQVVPAGASLPALVFEDVCVEFADDDGQEMGIHRRYQAFPWLAEAPRVRVTSGGVRDPLPSSAPGHDRRRDSPPGEPRGLEKPLGGIFQVQREAGLPAVDGFAIAPYLPAPARYAKFAASTWRGTITGVAALGRHLLASRKTRATSGDVVTQPASGHAVHGRILLIAERLVGRARGMVTNCNTVPAACRGAVLATDAFELLATRTPTMALDALSLKHQFEVLAECSFLGMRHHIELGARLREIEEATLEVTRHHGEVHTQRRAAANAALAICSSLIDLLKKNNRFDEEHLVLTKIRILNRKISLYDYDDKLLKSTWLGKKADLLVLKLIVGVASWYLERIISTPWRFIVCVMLWLVAFTFAFWFTRGPECHVFASSGIEAFTTFFSVQPAERSCVWEAKDGLTLGFGVVALAMVAGFVHLGVLISHLYSLMIRK